MVGVTHLFARLLEQRSADAMGSTYFNRRHKTSDIEHSKLKRPLGALRLFLATAIATIAFLGCFNTEGGSSSNEDRGNKSGVNLLLREVGDSHICQGQDATGPDKDA